MFACPHPFAPGRCFRGAGNREIASLQQLVLVAVVVVLLPLDLALLLLDG